MHLRFTYAVFLLLAGIPRLSAQQVYYCEPVRDRWTVRMEMVGKAGDYYWLERTRGRRVIHRGSEVLQTEEKSFEVYNSRMSAVSIIPAVPYPDNVLKEYYVPGDHYFDKIHLLSGRKKVGVWLQRFQPDGTPDTGRIVGVFPFSEVANSFLMVRSADRSKILIMGFEALFSASPKLHALLFDDDWRIIYDRVYTHPAITQPFLQDDFTGYPLEDFANGAVKVADNGEWLMTSPSRTNNNFLLFHFSGVDTAVACKEIMLPGGSSMEDVSLSIDNIRGEAVTGILSSFHYATLKNVQVSHYSLVKKSFDYDTSFRFSTLSGGRVRNENLVKENFISLQGKGFMLLKEYGRPFEDWFDDGNYDQQWDPAVLFATTGISDNQSGPVAGPRVSRKPPPVVRDGYSHYLNLVSAGGSPHDRGDLSLYYFPARRGDTAWSGLISKEQITEMNSPNLSYLVIPENDKLLFLYNAFVKGQALFATSTILNPRGDLVVDDGILFWGLRNILNFQKSRQIGPKEIVIPYDMYSRIGFAIVKF